MPFVKLPVVRPVLPVLLLLAFSFVLIAGLAAHSLAQGSDKAEAVRAFERIAAVMRHPRCMNCHQETIPLQGEERRLHIPRVVRGEDNLGVSALRCTNCHSETNNTASRVPGAPHWSLAPASMEWQGLSTPELCQVLTDKERNGGWTREDDIRGGYYRAMVLHKVRAGVGENGKLSGWHHKVVCKSLAKGTPFEGGMMHEGVDHTSVEGVIDTPYAIPDFNVEAYNAEAPMPVLWWRSVGHTHTAQVMESMIDELALALDKDQVEFRLGLLADNPRDAGVLKLAAEKAGWGEKLPEGKGRGIACHRSFKSYVAMVADVTVDGERTKVDRIVAAVDCGVAVNPDVIAAQIEGAVGFALSAVLRNRITVKDGRVLEGNFDTYNPTRMSEMPKVEVHIVKSAEAPTGVGEPGVPCLAPAICNAVFAATGKRHRSLPLEQGEAS